MEHIARPDPTVRRFVPDPTLVARAHNLMLEDEDPPTRFLRQRWEEAFAAVRVALDTLREIYPAEAERLGPNAAHGLAALEDITTAYRHLDAMSGAMLGWLMTGVLEGAITTHEEFERMVEG